MSYFCKRLLAQGTHSSTFLLYETASKLNKPFLLKSLFARVTTLANNSSGLNFWLNQNFFTLVESYHLLEIVFLLLWVLKWNSHSTFGNGIETDERHQQSQVKTECYVKDFITHVRREHVGWSSQFSHVWKRKIPHCRSTKFSNRGEGLTQVCKLPTHQPGGDSRAECHTTGTR